MITNDDIWIRAPGLNFENEAAVETRLIIPLLRALGYSEADHIAPKYPIVFREGRQGRRPEADFVLFAERPHSRATSLVVVEAKHPRESLSGGKEQGESYAANIRAPLLMMSNGLRIQIWQYQPTYESELALDCSITELPKRRGEFEALLAREAVLNHAQTMRHKSFNVLARDLGAYERAEFERKDGPEISISRRLRDAGSTSSEILSTNILATYPEGAVLIAASGYGKTTLARELRRQAIEKRWSGESCQIPIEVFLPDLPPSRDGFEAFLCARVAAHCPSVSLSAFKDHLRQDGIILLGDGFDRIPAEQRLTIESTLAIFQRDFPKIRLFLFTRSLSRPERLALPSLELRELNDEEKRDLVEFFSLPEGGAGRSAWYNAPEVLRSACRHPLILQLTLSHYKEKHRLPTRIETLFQTWLERIIPNSLPIARRIDLKKLLTIFANATIDGPLTESSAVDLTRSKNFSDDLLRSLFDTDALTQKGMMVELQHEALADYLRALDVVKLSPSEASLRLKGLPLRAGSQLPALLMAVASDIEMQRIVWLEIVSSDITAAIGALRYRADIALPPTIHDSAELSRRFLSEMLEGIELPLQNHFPRLADRIRLDLIGSTTERLGVSGFVEPQGGHLAYSFMPCGMNEDQVVVGASRNPRRCYGKSLFALGFRLDSGRLVGMNHILEGLLELIKERRLDGGLIWAEEMTFGRLRHLIREYDFPYNFADSLNEAIDILADQAGAYVMPDSFRSGQTFAVDDLISDIRFLIDQGRTHLKPWWDGVDSLDLTTPEGQSRLGKILNEHHRRVQAAYKELAEISFPSLSLNFPFYQMMPLQYEIEVELHHEPDSTDATLAWRWLPVDTFDKTGAVVTFPSELSDMWSRNAFDAYQQRIDEALARYSRHAPNRQYICGKKGIPDFLNSAPTHGGEVDETSVVRAVMARIREDIQYIFRDLAKSDRIHSE